MKLFKYIDEIKAFIFSCFIIHYRKNHNEAIPTERVFKIPNVDKVIKEAKKAPTKLRDIKLNSIGYNLNVDMYTPSGWPSVSGDVLKVLAGKVSAEYDFYEACNMDLDDEDGNPSQSEFLPVEIDKSTYGTAFSCFPTEEEGRDACHAIAALCEVCSIDSLISNFILPLQVIILFLKKYFEYPLSGFESGNSPFAYAKVRLRTISLPHTFA